ncbi:hypothetical protein MKZ38_009833 [Zalerion maritima]|uniref:Ima1 N-terminal domain-containing protein n=1 Tax=Zalerion maritima TaxID=339359 RepID=A0AAD5RYR1_9PEZI|nr:hypothetical protein MKZ38_009833 [Zalerion maritima]
MPTLRQQRYLCCHFCGQKSPYKWDGTLTQFHCTKCDAENYLDKNGEITDPPPSIFTSAFSPNNQSSSLEPPIRYASEPRRSTSPLPGSPSSPLSSSANIFCETCLKNQHMYLSALAQWYSSSDSDPGSDSESPHQIPSSPSQSQVGVGENLLSPTSRHNPRSFYRFKKSLESRYPQVCPSCLPKVDHALSQAGYRAKADHLRRMMDRSRLSRSSTKSRSALDYFDLLGRSFWILGLLLQLLWHLTLISSIIGEPVGLLSERDEPPEALLPLKKISENLPRPDTFSYYSVIASLAASWWNPQFPATFRGFTRHLNGLRNWYGFQVVIVVSRLVFMQVAFLKKAGGINGLTRLLTLHTGMALCMIYIYSVARRAVTKDHTPLFGNTSSSVPTPTKDLAPSPRKSHSQPAGTQSLSQALDDILQSPPSTLLSSPLQQTRFPNTLSPDSSPSVRRRPNPAATARFGSAPPDRASTKFSGGILSSFKFNDGLQRASSQDITAATYGDEMEWTPTASPHRAFNPSAQTSERDSQKFNASPTGPDKGPFWYRVPPQPVDPMSRARNPPKPLIKVPGSDLNQKVQKIFFRGSGKPSNQPHGTSIFGRKDTGGGQSSDGSGLRIAQPTFFAKTSENDPRNDLSGLFGQNFSLGADENGHYRNDDDDDELTEEEDEGTARRRRRPVSKKQNQGFTDPHRFAFIEVVILVSCLAAWVHTIWSPQWGGAAGAGGSRPSFIFDFDSAVASPPGGTSWLSPDSEYSSWGPVDDGDMRPGEGGEKQLPPPVQEALFIFGRTLSTLLTASIMGICFVLAGRITLGYVLQILACRGKSSQPGGFKHAKSRHHHTSSRKGGGAPVAAYAAVTLGATEMIVAGYCAFQIWTTTDVQSACANEGVYVLGAMVGHRIIYAYV